MARRALWALLCVLCTPPLAHAQTAVPDPAVSTSDAEQPSEGRGPAIERAVREYAAGNWREAEALFLDAHAVDPNARTARAIGMCAFNLRDYPTAIRYLRESLTVEARALTPEQREGVQELLDQASRFVARVTILTRPAEASVTIDGRPLQGTTALLPLGEHTVRATSKGYHPHEETFEVTRGVETRRTLELVAQVDPTEPAKWAPKRHWVWITGSAALAAGAVAVGFGVRGEREFSELQTECEQRRCLASNTDTDGVQRSAKVVNASIGIAAALVLTSASLWVWRARVDRRRPVTVELGAGAGGLDLKGSF